MNPFKIKTVSKSQTHYRYRAYFHFFSTSFQDTHLVHLLQSKGDGRTGTRTWRTWRRGQTHATASPARLLDGSCPREFNDFNQFSHYRVRVLQMLDDFGMRTGNAGCLDIRVRLMLSISPQLSLLIA
jgi:hypothetical protein